LGEALDALDLLDVCFSLMDAKKMARSFLLPMNPEHDYVQAKIYDLKIDTDYFLIVDRNVVPSFNYKYFNEDREIVIYVKDREYLMKKYSSDESIKVELFDDEGIDAVICAIKRLFPCAPICAFVLKKYCRKLKNLFPDVELLVA
jgi:hypothetical protein